MNHHHEGVSCDSCLQSSFRGKRYKCLLCYDFDLCSTCYEAGITKQQHNADHPMQCILPRADIELYYGGETLLNSDQPQSFTCPYCCHMGFTLLTLIEHVSRNHSDNPFEVICPVCVTVPGGDPNRMTDDLTRHLTLDHRSAARDVIPLLDEGIAIRVHDARRVPHPSFRGRTRPRRANMQFNPGTLAARTLRDPVDPIAELLSHLSGVRRSVSNTNSGAFQQFQMQWQLDRHVHATRQHLERLSQHQARCHSVERKTLSNGDSSASPSISAVQSSSKTTPRPSISSNFLLPKAIEELSVQTSEDTQINRRQFVQELTLSTLAKPGQTLMNKDGRKRKHPQSPFKGGNEFVKKEFN
ncbi:hypothetical protein ILUMI_07036 [Ignelater luminosus]|uniref:RING-type E3 ubiquitin transferase n=1 Tax=Ignelater luminosus TaxID=2038154 RepID=A0A8K0GES5_IGNLU|nr:hypothetical protein ILUMI_07036 [Ignelater luminosus]